ncbi:hypothetical protein Acsp03_42190 [Actinomadura sp. NBRC 104412]|uniref:hypothetical protein n=1 Tax=Actinomadura sp. NBRC 104412 TaxID=3032203 RepID=UPI0024A0BDBB|nr:hypothetical protein [Actinomadura sp. NBRC 104412]GLZ06753.1 hypothetical protein Acsp03_42190 [Actinomadura sp. NBRC 104412]
MVCAASSTGRWMPANTRHRAAHTPSTTPIASVRTVATSTCASVCMLCSHTPVTAIAPRQPAPTAACTGPATRHPMATTTTIISHHGLEVRSVCSGLSSATVTAFLIASVTPNRCSHPLHDVVGVRGEAELHTGGEVLGREGASEDDGGERDGRAAAQHETAAARVGRAPGPLRGLRPAAGAHRQPVQDDRHHDHGQPRVQGHPHVDALQPLDDRLAQPGAVDQRGDDHHRQRPTAELRAAAREAAALLGLPLVVMPAGDGGLEGALEDLVSRRAPSPSP